MTQLHGLTTPGIGELIDEVTRGSLTVDFTAYDGSRAGRPGAARGLHLRNERGAAYLLTAPGDLGLARAYVSGDLVPSGVHPGDPYELLRDMAAMELHRPTPAQALALARRLGRKGLTPPPPPPEESVPRWRRVAEGVRHNLTRDASAIQHHYDVSNRFYELVLGPSMTYTCA